MARETDPPRDDPTPEAAPDAGVPVLDARGLLCPLPVLKLRKRLQPLAPGARIRMIADDPAARVDVPHFCAEQGHKLLAEEEEPGGALGFLVEKRS